MGQPSAGVEFATLGTLTKALQDNYPTLVEKAYSHDGITSVVSIGDKHYREGIHPGDSTFFEVFNFPVAYGDVLGIVTLSIARRNKEMGIRKVLGASVFNIIALFVKEFSWIIVVANVVAWPLAWYILHSWLMDYAYRIDIGAWPFLLVGGLLVLLVSTVIVAMTKRLAAANPVRNLRTE